MVAYVSDDTIMLRALKLPSVEEFEAAMIEAQERAASAGYTEDDVNDIIKSVKEEAQMEMRIFFSTIQMLFSMKAGIKE